MSELPSVAKLSVKVVPRASRSEITGWLGDRLKVKIAAPPQDGRANAALEAFLADTLGLPKRNVRVASGHGSSSKIVELEGIGQTELVDRLDALLR